VNRGQVKQTVSGAKMTIPEALNRSLARHPQKPAIVCGERSWNYEELEELTKNIAGNLLSAGLEPGDRVAFHLFNGPELALGYIGCLKAGCIAVPINTRLKGPEIDYILRHSGSACYIGQPELHTEVARSCPAMNSLELRFSTGDLLDGEAKSFEDLLLAPRGSVSIPEINGEHVAAILYTSGTTARPKGVMHSHESLVRTAQTMRQMDLDEDQVVVVMSSMSHMIGFAMMFLSGLVNGATVVLTRPFDFKSTLQAFTRWRGTYLAGLPVMFHGLIQTQIEMRTDVASGRFYFCGGDSVPGPLQEAFEETFGPACEVYGATEIAPAAWNRAGQVRVGSIGCPGVGTEFRLLDSNELEVEGGEVGEICIRGPHLTLGYWQDPEATAAAIRNGWFHSGDLARRDADGFYWFAGRKKEIIVRGGSNISPQEVEAVFYQHASVKEVGVIGRPDDVWGEVVVAFVVLRSGQPVAEAELIAFARQRLADYKTPERVIFRDELPKGPTGKIQRRALRAEEHAFAPMS
jgi:long-chain acyl-CoA synthetase